MLSNKDSNLDRQNQNLQCYHYTIRQSLFRILNVSAKIQLFLISATKKIIFFKVFLYLIYISEKVKRRGKNHQKNYELCIMNYELNFIFANCKLQRLRKIIK